jgi:O-acetyl-ADP-ribose deacetylase (regulator of RNase III)
VIIFQRKGDLIQLSVDVMVNPTNESLSDANSISSRIIAAAGPKIVQELDQLGGSK